MSAREQKWYEVPAGARASQCRGQTCHATIYWVRNPATGRMLPVDCDVEGGNPPSDTDDASQVDAFAPNGLASVYVGRGVSHFETCADVAQFTSGGKR